MGRWLKRGRRARTAETVDQGPQQTSMHCGLASRATPKLPVVDSRLDYWTEEFAVRAKAEAGALSIREER
jgi:hypothetical protein